MLARVELVPDAYVFSDDIHGAVPWKPDAVSQYFGRLRDRAGLTHVDFHDLRRFMETYGQEMGYSVAQVAMRAGHDPSVAARHYSGRSSRPIVISPTPSRRCSPRRRERVTLHGKRRP